MNVFPIEPKFPIGEVGFKDTYKDDNGQEHPLDLLGRKVFGQRLTDLVDSTPQPLVIALDGPWGSGKSHFLKLWAGAHKLELKGQAEVIYFDAFEQNFFLDDPLVSLVAKLAKDAPERGLAANALKKVKTAAAPLLKLGARIGLAVVTGVGSEVVGAVGDAAIGAIGKTAEEKIDEFWKTETTRIAAMSEFRAALEALTKKEDETTQKIVFIIDELDRCRPDYALQMLEIIKHFFTVPNVHFVLGANLTELENSVRARYGAGINARKYLQKFVMLEMRLPEVILGRDAWSTYLTSIAGRLKPHSEVHRVLLESLKATALRRQITIRDAQRIALISNLSHGELADCYPAELRICVDFIILSVLSPDVFRDFLRQAVTVRKLATDLNINLFDSTKDSERSRAWSLLLFQEDISADDRRFLLEEQGHLLGHLNDRRDEIRRENYDIKWRDLQVRLRAIFFTFTLPTP